MLKKYWKQTFEDEKTETEIFIARFFLLFNVLVFLAIVITAIVALGILHRPERASIIIILGAIVVINFGAIFIHKQIKYGAMILSFALCIILAYLMGSFNVSENSPTWTIVAIVVIMYLLGKHWGTQLSLFFIGAQIFCYIVLNDKTHYPASPFVLSVFSQIITIGLLYFYLQFNEQKDNKIIEAKKQLEEEIRAKNTVVTQLDSTITNLQAQSTDIEQNKRAMLNVLEDLNAEKEKLQREEEQLEEAQKIGKFGNFTWNLETNEIHWSAESFHIHGLQPNAALSPPPMEEYFGNIHPDDREEAQKSSAAALTSKDEHSFEYRTVWPDKSIHWVKVASNAEFNDSGKATFLKGTFQDITRQVEDKIKIEEKNARDEAILSSIADGLFMTDREGKINLMNSAAEKMFGWNQSEVIGKFIGDVFPIKTRNGQAIPNSERPSIIALVSQKASNGVYIYTRKDGIDFPAAITIAPVIQEGNAVGVVEIFRDVTQEENVDRMKTEFISLASHQLRTPLSAMKWSLEMLLGGDAGELDTEKKELIESVNTSNERMISLVNSLLNVSRIESGRIIIDPKPTEIKALIEGVIDEVKQKLDDKKQSLTLSLSDNLPTISIDPNLVRQVYANLLTNANKYSPESTEIQIRITETENDILSEVADAGYGIPIAEQKKVFEKFYRGKNIVQMSTDGNGLGLYLVKAIVESSGGKIWFTSEENKGTSFFFSLPKTGSVAKIGEVHLNS